MKKNMLLSLIVAAAGIFSLVMAGCTLRTDPVSPSLASSLKPLVTTNFSFLFSGGSVDGFMKEAYSSADVDGGCQASADNEHLFIWITNAKRSRGGGWFWGGWKMPFTNPTNMYGNPTLDEDWAFVMVIKAAKIDDFTPFFTPSYQIVQMPFNFQIVGTNASTHTKGTLTYVSPGSVPANFAVYDLRVSDFTISGSMTDPVDVLQHARQIGFMLDNAQIPDGVTFGFLVDYIIIGTK